MTGSTITGNTSKSIERHIGSSYKTIVYVSKYLNEVKIVSDNIESGVFTDTLDNLGNIALVSTNMDNVVTVASISEDVVAVANASTEVIAVSTNIDDVVRVRQSIDDVIRVSQSADNVDRIALSIDNLDRVFASIDNIDTVANHADAVDTVAANIAAVLNISANMADVINASSFVGDIHASVAAAALSEANALASEQASAANATQTSLDAASTSADKADVTTMRDEVETDRAEVELNTAQVSIDAAQVSTDKGIVEGYKDESLAAKLLAQQWAVGDSGTGASTPSDTNNAFYFSEQAQQSENNAALHESGAGDYALLAQRYANEAVDTEVESGLYSAKHYATKAEESSSRVLGYGGEWTPTAGTEYPTPTYADRDEQWYIAFADPSTNYLFTTGDLAGKTAFSGYILTYKYPELVFNLIATPSGAGAGAGILSINNKTGSSVEIGSNDIPHLDTDTSPTTVGAEMRAHHLDIQSNASDIAALQSSKMDKLANLSDLQSASVSRTNLDVYSKQQVDTRLENKINAIALEVSANTFMYDNGRLIQQTIEHGDGQEVITYTYTNNVLTQAVSVRNGITKTTTYTYTDGRLIGVTTA